MPKESVEIKDFPLWGKEWHWKELQGNWKQNSAMDVVKTMKLTLGTWINDWEDKFSLSSGRNITKC